ncbi:MAG: TonB-dependent receptor [Bacteroidales bacterium]
MKISTFLLCVTFINISASTLSQEKISLDMENVTIKQVFTEIEQSSAFKFLYRNELVNVDREVTIDVENEPIESVLAMLFNQSDLTYRLFEDNLVVVTSKSLQQKKINGKVTDAQTGEPLPGVNISIEGTNSGTTTALDGSYSLDVPGENAALIFSYIGYNTERIELAGQTVLDINLVPDITALEEVVVVGYGVQKKSDVTGSVTSVSKERLAKLPVNNVMQAIQGSAAGVNVSQASSVPGDAPSTLIRGRGSMNAATDPYIVVDGIPLSKTDASINDINPNDIQSVEILKDASATAIYGTNGANGVILITTKRGDKGAPQIRYNGYAGVEEFAHILEPGSGEDLVQTYKDYAAIQSGVTFWPGTEVRNEYEAENWLNGKTTDWLDAVTQTGIVQDHNVSVSGGTENMKYYVSGEYLDQKGVVKGYNYKRYSIRTNLDVNVTNYLEVGLSSFFTMHNRDGGRANLLNAVAMSPYGRMYNEDGTYTQHPMRSETLWTNPMLNTTLDPERRAYNATLNGYTDLDFGKIWKPITGLKYKLNAGYTYAPQRENSYEGRSVYNMQGYARMFNRESQTWTLENILTYSKDIGVHHFDLTALYASKSKYYQQSAAEARNFPSDELEWGSLGAGANYNSASMADLYNTLSQMGRLNYSYDSRYLFTFTVRRDGSSVFSKNNKYGVFPSVAIGWNVSREAFMAPLNDVVNNLKLRISYGKTGNEAIGIYQSLTKLEANTLAMGGLTKTSLKVNRTMGNDDLTWESTTSFNTGIDFGLWNNRVNGTLDVYFSNTTDLLMRRNLPTSLGYDNVWSNMGEVTNNGIELTINSKNFTVNNFSWNTTLVFASNKNKIKELYGDGLDDRGNRWFIGEPIGVIFDYKMVGIWQEDEIAANEHVGWDNNARAGDVKLADISGPDGTPDGVITDLDRSVLGQTIPKWTGGITNTFTYKGLALSVFINTVQGLKRNNPQIGVASDEKGRRNSPKEIGYWTPENKSNEWRSLSHTSNRYGYGFPVDASFTRIKDITLSYNFSSTITRKLSINALQLYVSGRNIHTFTDWIGWDPEARDIGRGSENWEVNYPLVRSYVFGVNVTL